MSSPSLSYAMGGTGDCMFPCSDHNEHDMYNAIMSYPNESPKDASNLKLTFELDQEIDDMRVISASMNENYCGFKRDSL